MYRVPGELPSAILSPTPENPMKPSTVLGLLLSAAASVAIAQKPPTLVGTWNVTSTPTGDFSCSAAATAGPSAYIWIISSAAEVRST